MKKYIPFILTLLTCYTLFAQKDTAAGKQFILVVRYNTGIKMPVQEVIQNNIKHWMDYMSGLAQSGKLVSGFRPGTEGSTVTGATKLIKEGVYVANDEILSSIIIIRSSSIGEATSIAKNCPILELGGSVEIRPIMDIAQ